MNNAQFRRLLLDNSTKQTKSSDKPAAGAAPRQDGLSLGSKMRSSIPMTPRSVMGSGGVDFARQLAERDQSQQSQKKFRSSAAPKGAKLPTGYRDRTQDRVSIEDDNKASRIKALEEMWKLDQIDRATFEKLRDEIVGGDISSTHLVKGLDYKLLERVRRGEDVLNESPVAKEKESAAECGLDEELEKLEDKEVVPIAKQKAIKRGEMAPPPGPGAVAGRKRTRDEILAELKASRQAAKAAQQPSLGPKFRNIGEPKEKSRIERDKKGREVLVTVDKDGKVKKKVRKSIAQQSPKGSKDSLLMPEKGAKPLGMEVPDFAAKPAEEPEEDIDIFEGVGTDYDPFAGLGDGDEDDDDSSSEEGGSRGPGGGKSPAQEKDDTGDEDDEIRSPQLAASSPESKTPPGAGKEPTSAPRNYFTTSTSSNELSTSNPAPLNPLTDPAILAALRKASTIDPLRPSAIHDPEEAAREARRRKLLDTHDRDAEDMDLGFGSSRFEDEEDMEEKKVKLSTWGGDDKEGKGGGKGKRKRGPKKRKGDVNSAADVMKAIERRKQEGK